MSVRENHIDEELIIQYLNGDLSDAEKVRQVEQWLSHSENIKEAREIYKTWELTLLASPPKKDAEQAFQQLERRIRPAENRKSKSVSLWWYAAASVLVICLFTYIITNKQGTPEMTTLATNEMVAEFTLQDGTSISLNAYGKIEYDQQDFADADERRVLLDGVAFFNVEHQSERPFIVSTHDAEIKVLGTEFMVKTSSEAPTEVLVTQGKVQVTYLVSKEVITLTAKEEVKPQKIDQTINLIVTPSDDNQLYWKTGVMIFDHDSLGKVFQTLSEEFKTTIRVENEEILSCDITATFKRQSLDTIIEVIKSTHQLNSYIDNGQIIITGNGCQ
ncbi:MAG: FecR domain-containing protein [Bacteroidota bacterium]